MIFAPTSAIHKNTRDRRRKYYKKWMIEQCILSVREVILVLFVINYAVEYNEVLLYFAVTPPAGV